jgi:hypothetical protein
MSKPFKVKPVYYFTGLIFRKDILFDDITALLTTTYGEIDAIIPPIDFRWTSYYKGEMGQNLLRSWVFFRELINPSLIVRKKLESLPLEEKFSDEKGQRFVNIDPGYMTPARIVLSTFKDFSHRIYLGDSVYAEVTMIFVNNTFHALPWTYPDYSDPENVREFIRIRNGYMKRLRQKE